MRVPLVAPAGGCMKRRREVEEGEEEAVDALRGGDGDGDDEGKSPYDDEEAEEEEGALPRTRSEPSSSPPAKKAPRTKRVEEGGGRVAAVGAGARAASLDAIYGEGAAATVQLKPELAHNLKLSSVHELITWVMTDHGRNPRWAFVRHKPLVSKVVMLLAPGIDRERVATSAELMPRVRSAMGQGVTTVFDNPTANEFNVARALLCSVNDSPPSSSSSRQRGSREGKNAKRAHAVGESSSREPGADPHE